MERLPLVDASEVLAGASPRVLERAFLVLGLLAHGYVFQDTVVGGKPVDELPPQLAVPWCQVAAMVGRPPVITHSSIALANYHEIDEDKGAVVDNLGMNSLFLGGMDEAWFYTAALGVEGAGAPALVGLVEGMHGVVLGEPEMVLNALQRVLAAVLAMDDALARLPERCMPAVFYSRIRLFLAGWAGNSELPNGLTYAGVTPDFDHTATRPERVAAASGSATPSFVGKFNGASAAQSSLIQALDAGLDIEHESAFLDAMVAHMPRPHARLIDALWHGPSLREYAHACGEPAVLQMYLACREALALFRNRHIQIVARYILQQSPARPSSEKGTGGTSIMPFLKGIRDTTRG
ncbi:murine indoleamine 2 [Thecamonas trahens ATCC 50062]|uniref:Indoleamine 2 n=1 Tax=Thecamonas trahens ATCC 50062 TaxID=461836 RepID=A0A0L0DJP8_THETB|nr:murine indoleamine 2 [Thecamonas trahens ATCC 50062]KNC51518.1 murine indoleamine 2 [Thecamonas trahens ATCC 50062]|eukprot:XP_013755921.1 murine indoleamine 2 [Thecamonas trahens ATCC 50062]